MSNTPGNGGTHHNPVPRLREIANRLKLGISSTDEIAEAVDSLADLWERVDPTTATPG